MGAVGGWLSGSGRKLAVDPTDLTPPEEEEVKETADDEEKGEEPEANNEDGEDMSLPASARLRAKMAQLDLPASTVSSVHDKPPLSTRAEREARRARVLQKMDSLTSLLKQARLSASMHASTTSKNAVLSGDTSLNAKSFH